MAEIGSVTSSPPSAPPRSAAPSRQAAPTEAPASQGPPPPTRDSVARSTPETGSTEATQRSANTLVGGLENNYRGSSESGQGDTTEPGKGGGKAPPQQKKRTMTPGQMRRNIQQQGLGEGEGKPKQDNGGGGEPEGGKNVSKLDAGVAKAIGWAGKGAHAAGELLEKLPGAHRLGHAVHSVGSKLGLGGTLAAGIIEYNQANGLPEGPQRARKKGQAVGGTIGTLLGGAVGALGGPFGYLLGAALGGGIGRHAGGNFADPLPVPEPTPPGQRRGTPNSIRRANRAAYG